MECVHCYADAQTRRFIGGLTTDEAQRIIEDLADFNVPALLVSGGEPLVRPDILDLAEYATSLGVRVTFSTNGTLIDRKKAEGIAASASPTSASASMAAKRDTISFAADKAHSATPSVAFGIVAPRAFASASASP